MTAIDAAHDEPVVGRACDAACILLIPTGAGCSTTLLRRSRRSGDDRNTEDQVEQSLAFKRCCACAGIFEYDLGENRSVYIFSGLPPNGISYTAVSYLWDKVNDFVVRCESCSYLTMFPMHSLAKLQDLMRLAGSSMPVWLDAISIDQGDANDIAAQVSIMGTMYANAAGAAVLLPKGDHVGFEALGDITHRSSQWQTLVSDQEEPEAEQAFRHVVNLSKDFLSAVESFESTFQGLRYSSRAWTFQEWSLAKDLSVNLEGSQQAESVTFHKSSVFTCTSLLCQYIITNGDQAEIDLPWWGRVTKTFDVIRRILPLEDNLLSADEVDLVELEFQMNFPGVGSTEVLRLRTGERTAEFERKKARLQLMLSAFGRDGRQATVPADTVACWASMCNVPYSYDKADSVSTALRKAIAGIRDMGLEVFDFIPPEMQRVEQLTTFYFLSTAQRISHAKDVHETLEYSDLSFLRGRVDTLLYIQLLLGQDWSGYFQEEARIGYQRVVGAVEIAGLAPLSDSQEIMAT